MTKRPTKKPAKPRGGARPGAGRPRDQLPAEVLKRLGPPPRDVDKLAAWNLRLLAEVQWARATGAIGTELAESLRAGATAIGRTWPDDFDDDGDGDGDGDGPQLELVDSTGDLDTMDGLRVE